MSLSIDDTRYDAIARRDRDLDGVFITAVKTTGIYCRPSCTARLPQRKNVSFYATWEAAEAAGFRACKRCHPKGDSQAERHAAAVRAACIMIDEAEESPVLARLAENAGLSPYHFHRVFKSVTGVTPKAYASARRAERFRGALASNASITSAIYDAGYNASSRFYERSNERLGMTPSAWRDGGAGTAIRFAVGECRLGSILVAATAIGVCAIEFGDDPAALVHGLQDRFAKADFTGGDADFERMVGEVIALVDAPGQVRELPLDIGGTLFQQKVWQALRKIPAGRRVSYAEVAQSIGQPKAVRAVATACAANVLAVAIPCHRVVRSDGGMGGYRWGIERKRDLLAAEQRERHESPPC